MIKNKIALVLLPPFWPNSPPLNIASLKAFLQSKRIAVTAIDYNNLYFQKASLQLQREWKQSCNQHLNNNMINLLANDFRDTYDEMINELLGYDIVGFSCFKSNYKTTCVIANALKEQKQSLRIVFGGPEITRRHFKYKDDLYNKYKKYADCFVIGEGELALYEYVAMGDQCNNIVKYKELDSLSELPLPDYSDLNFNHYPKKSSVSLMASRGCIKKCLFCSEKLLYKKYRQVPVENIIKQIATHRDQGISNFIFHDSLINGNLTHLESLCDAIINNFGSINWEAQFVIRNDMPERLFNKIKQSGCYHFFIGLESGCDSVLTRMNKGYRAGDAVDFFKQLNKAKLSFGVSMIVGFPGETENEFQESLDFILTHKSLIPKIEQVNPYVYYEGTNLPPEADCKTNQKSLQRADRFIKAIKEAGFKHTKAFMLNLIER